MKQILLICAVVALVGCGGGSPDLTNHPKLEEAIRKYLEKPEGELTKADLEKVTSLFLSFTKTGDTGLKEVAKLQQLEWLSLDNTQITDKGLKEVAKLQQLEWLA
ncbi:MAG: hypothetical protein ACKJR1_08785, partial [Limisphaerales bacterium]